MRHMSYLIKNILDCEMYTALLCVYVYYTVKSGMNKMLTTKGRRLGSEKIECSFVY